MKWFKHISDSLDDPFIFDLLQRFGADGYLVFFGIIEIYSREFQTKDDWKLSITRGYLKRKLCKRQDTLVMKSLEHIKNSGKWVVEIKGNDISIFIPKFKSLLDDSTLKKLREHEKSFRNDSGTLPKVAPTDKEEDKEEDKDLKAGDRPVDNSEPEPPKPPFKETTKGLKPTPEEQEEEVPFPGEEKAKVEGNGKDDAYLQELKALVAQVKTKYPRYPIEQWYGRNIKAPPDKILQVLRNFCKADLKCDGNKVIDTYLQNSIDVETGKTNARLFEAEQEGKKGPPTVKGMASMRQVLAGIGAGR